MRKKEKEPRQIAVARYCVENSEKGFDKIEFVKNLVSTETDQ